MLKAGAAGYVAKESAPRELCGAVRKVLGGGKYITATLAERLATEIQVRTRLPHEALSNREHHVMLRLSSAL